MFTLLSSNYTEGQSTHLYIWQKQYKQLFVVKVGLVQDVVGTDGRVRVTVE